MKIRHNNKSKKHKNIQIKLNKNIKKIKSVLQQNNWIDIMNKIRMQKEQKNLIILDFYKK